LETGSSFFKKFDEIQSFCFFQPFKSVPMSESLYNQIGKDYNETRTSDPGISDRFLNHLNPRHEEKYLDIGCGTGNYLSALEEKGLDMTGIDPSEIMLEAARRKNPLGRYILGKAEEIPFPDQFFHGGIGMLTTHHWTDLEKGYQELHRVIKDGGKLVLFTFTPDQVLHYWLKEYFPTMIQEASSGIQDLSSQMDLLKKAGWKHIFKEEYRVDRGVLDHFMYASKYQPEKYLDKRVRDGISAFQLTKNPNEIESGLKRLKADIESGRIYSQIQEYEKKNPFGDYIFLIAGK